MATTNMSLPTLERVIERAIEQEITNAMATVIERAQGELAKEIRSRIPNIIATVHSHYSMQRMGADLIITVKADV